jgi:hypothetical protein
MRSESADMNDDVTGENAAMQNTRRSWTRTLAWGLLGGIALLVVGDRGARTAGGTGQDPLDVLNLQVRANAIIVVDSSGSMSEALGSGDLAGDAHAAKLWKAKQVLKQVIQENERKVSFQFGQYKQPGVGSSSFGFCSVTTTQSCNPGACPAGESCVTGPMRVPTTGFGRFLYTTSSCNVADTGHECHQGDSMTTNELLVDVRTYVVPAGQRIRMRENGGTLTDRVECQVAPGTYRTAFEFADAVATAMSNCGTNGNTYTVTVAQNNAHRFSFTRVGSASWGIRWDLMTGTYNTLRTFLVGNGLTGSTGDMNVNTYTPGTNGNPTTAIDLKRDASVSTTNGGKFTETVGGDTFVHYKLYARRFFNGQRILVRPDGVACSTTPDPGTTGIGGDGTGLGQEPWVDIELGTTTCSGPATPAQVVRFKFSSVPRSTNFLGNAAADGEWRTWTGNGTCGGFESLVPLQPCTQNAQFGLVSPFLDDEIEIDAGTRWPVNYAEDAVGNVTSQPAVGGMRAAGNTPIAQSLIDIDSVWEGSLWPTISGYSANGPFPKTFVIFLTDGDDTCETAGGGSTLSDDQRALRAAYRAQLLYQAVDSSSITRRVASSVTTFVVAFGTGAAGNRSDWIAYGGSGMNNVPNTPNVIPLTNHGGAIGSRWSRSPTAAEVAACTTCRPAFQAGDEEALGRALQIAIDQGQAAGTFSDQQSVTDSIFELSSAVGFDPRNPQTRYSSSVPVLLQSVFEMPNFNGRFRAFKRGVGTSDLVWDAGDELRSRVVNGVFGTDGMGTSDWSYAEIRGSGTDANIVSSNARIKRRIYTSNGNGVFQPSQDDLLNGTGPGRITLWPPEPSVDPAGTGGIFDDEMHIQLGQVFQENPPPAPMTTVTYDYLRAKYGACTATVALDMHPNCTTPPTTPTAAALARAVMESRRIILASMAGADLVKIGNVAVRRPADKELLFRAKAWPIVESTLAAPAIVGPPPPELPAQHAAEWDLFARGPRDNNGDSINAVMRGLGLRDPDKDSTDNQNDNRQSLKPVMTVAYHAANDMLHAFRAGPCRDNSANSNCLNGVNEAGGEELWGFVPYDLLGNLPKLVFPQTRADHTYMLATPVRLTPVFVPGTWSVDTYGGEGLWRHVIVFGRGIAGRYMTALDVTAPGPFTQGSLSTTGPIVLWNRGNPDTQNGLVGGPANNTVSGNDDAAAYADMGQTWSVPAVAFVEARFNRTPRKPNGVDFVAYVGSGYTGREPSSPEPEGKRFYALDVLTGDVISSTNVGNRGGFVPFENALVSGPVAFNELALSNRLVATHPAETPSTLVYFNDIHGRLYRVKTDDPGTVTLLGDVNGNANTVNHPLGVSPSLLFYGEPSQQEYPHIYIESGNDNRIFSPEANPPTTPPFKAWALVDKDLTSDPDGGDGVDGPVEVLFTKDFPDLYRGTAQPATAFTESGFGRVFFVGTRFNPPGTQFAPPPPPCRSSFDSILFALGAGTGNAAYDLNSGADSDEYIEYRDEQLKSVQTQGGQVIVDRGLNTSAPTPPPPDQIAPPIDGSVFAGLSVPDNFVVSHRETPFSGSSAVCR